MKTINIIGGGRVGQTLGRLWNRHRVLRVQSILNRSLESARRAVEFVGEGAAAETYAQLGPADFVLISTADESIGACCEQLCRAGRLAPGAIVFHCSGSLPASVLAPARDQGAGIASVHPVMSFAEPDRAVAAFRGTYCALEGDAAAGAALRAVFERCGAILFPVAADAKPVYHAATVVVSNYLVALVEVGLRCLERAGVGRDTGREILHPIVAATARNAHELGPARALTGPVARGDTAVVAEHCAALGAWDPDVARVYQGLGLIAVQLAARQGGAGPEQLAAIEAQFRQIRC